jgi:hypothetical protein
MIGRSINGCKNRYNKHEINYINRLAATQCFPNCNSNNLRGKPGRQ